MTNEADRLIAKCRRVIATSKDRERVEAAREVLDAFRRTRPLRRHQGRGGEGVTSAHITDWNERAAAEIIAGSTEHRQSLAIMEAYRTWSGCAECLPGCEASKTRTRAMCPRFAVHISSTIGEILSARMDCMDCGTGHFSCPPLHDHIWRSIADDGFLCWPCVEKRLGRSLTLYDLMPCGWNSWRNPTMRRQRWEPEFSRHFRVARWRKNRRGIALLPISIFLSTRPATVSVTKRFRPPRPRRGS